MAIIFDIGDLQSVREKTLFQPFWKEVLEWLARQNSQTKHQEHVVSKDPEITATVGIYDLCKIKHFEAHQRFADVHMCLTDNEAIDVAPSTSLKMIRTYDTSSDTVLLRPPTIPTTKVVLSPGRVAILLPSDAHRPLQIVPDSQPLTTMKVIIKVSMALF